MPLSGIKPSSDSAVVRNNLAEIEAALETGVSREKVYEVLKAEHELSFNFNGFCQALKRARAKKRNGPARPGIKPALASVAGVYCAIQKKVLCNTATGGQATSAIQHEPETKGPEPSKVKAGRIVTSKDFSDVHDLDFSTLDDKYK